MLNFPLLLEKLALRRPIFHSEADFQHEFALTIRDEEPTAQLRLEVPFKFEKRGATDIVVSHQGEVTGVELKYLTRRLDLRMGGEEFSLRAQGATDLRRYDILKDVQRLERFNVAFGGQSVVIALTNDPAYWTPTSRVGTIDAAFRLCEGRVVSGDCSWAPHASPGSIRNREAPLALAGSYTLSWQFYSSLGVAGGEFRYLLIPVG